MPRRDDIHRILVLGSGPIVIGQACEFDYSGTQALKALARGGLRGRPAQLESRHDHDGSRSSPTGRTSSRCTPSPRRAVWPASAPTRCSPRWGARRRLNLAIAAAAPGASWSSTACELIGAPSRPSSKAEDREQFKAAMQGIGLDVAAAGYVRSSDEARVALGEHRVPGHHPPVLHHGRLGRRQWPTTGRSSTSGSAFALAESLDGEVLVEESVLGWKEFELEVMRDGRGQLRRHLLASRTSTPWASTPATASPWPRRRP